MAFSDYIDTLHRVATGHADPLQEIYGVGSYVVREMWLDSGTHVELYYRDGELEDGYILSGDKYFSLDEDELHIAEEAMTLYSLAESRRNHG